MKFECTVKRLINWETVLNSARTTVGKEDLTKEPSDNFKLKILLSEHSPIRNLTFEVVWKNLPYWVAMHLRTHHNGFKSSQDDLFFITTQRSDRTGENRDEMPQNVPVTLRVIMNAQSIINVSRVRLCKKSAKETIEAWKCFLKELEKIEPILVSVCVPNCVYRAVCPETTNTCKFTKTKTYQKDSQKYIELFDKVE